MEVWARKGDKSSKYLGAFLCHGFAWSFTANAGRGSLLTPYGRLLAMGFPLPPASDQFRSGILGALPRLLPAQSVKLAGNGYHLHEQMCVLFYALSNVVRRPACVLAKSLPLEFHDSSDDEVHD